MIGAFFEPYDFTAGVSALAAVGGLSDVGFALAEVAVLGFAAFVLVCGNAASVIAKTDAHKTSEPAAHRRKIP